MINKIKKIYLISGAFGLLVLFPQLFTAHKFGIENPPLINHPEFYYGFICLGLTFQILILIISTDPIRYRLIMIPVILGKASFGAAVVTLFFTAGVSTDVFIFGIVDLCLMCLFVFAFGKTSGVK